MSKLTKWLAAMAIIGSTFLLGFLYQYYSPLLKSWILVEIERMSREKLSVGIYPKDVQLKILPLGLKLREVRIIPQNKLKENFNQLSINEIYANLSPLSLLRGSIHFSQVGFDGLSTTISISEKNNSTPWAWPEITKEELFNIFKQIPIDEVRLENSSMELILPNTASIRLLDFDLFIQKEHRELDSKLYVNKIEFTYKKKPTLFANSKLTFNLNETGIDITAFEIKTTQSNLSINGKINNIYAPQPAPTFQLNSQSNLELNEIVPIISTLFPRKNLPNIQGSLNEKIICNINNSLEPNCQGTIDLKNININNFIVGDITGSGKYSHNIFNFESLSINNNSGKASFDNFEIQLNDHINLHGNLIADNISLNQLLKNLTVGDIPVYMNIFGNLPCEGTLFPEFQIDCKGKLEAKNFLVINSITEKSPLAIAELDKFAVDGQVSISSQNVIYNSDIQIGNIRGSSSGIIDYKTGFHITYQTEGLADIGLIKKIAGMNIAGLMQIKGSTEGNSSTATATMNLKGKQFAFENFYLGQISSLLEYRNGELKFTDIKGNINSTNYNGNLSINLNHENLAIKMILPQLEISDITLLFSNYFKFPVSVTGKGYASFEANGPFDLQKLSYTLKSHIDRGQIASEHFDRFDGNVHSDNGNLTVDKLQIKKSGSTIYVSGTGKPDSTIDLNVTGHDFHIEDFESINQIFPNLAGVLNITAHLTGPIVHPEATIKGAITQFGVKNLSLEDSKFSIHISPSSIEGTLAVLGNHIQGTFNIPFRKNLPLQINIESTNWDYTTYLALFNDENLDKDYEGNLTGKITVKSSTGGFENSTGEIEISQLSLGRNELNVSNTDTIKISLSHGLIDIENFSLSGQNSFFTVKGHNFTKDNLNFSIIGKTDLKLLQLFTPFLSELSGPVDASLKISGNIEAPEILGSLLVDNGYMKIKNFPHPIEKLKADILFSQSKILINSVKAQIADGQASGEGSIEFKGYKDIPIRINLKSEGANLNFPDKVKTTGIATLNISGHWFPYSLTGTYEIQKGLMTMEFTDNALSSQSTKQNSFLPKILEKSFEPLLIDMQVNIERGIEVKNSQFKGHILGDLRIKGTPSSPQLTGQLHANSGDKLYFRDTAFDVIATKFSFNENENNNPEIYISAQSRIQDTYDVNLLVQGKADALQIRLSSQPYLSEQDLISLLALGITSQSSEKEKDTRGQASFQVGTAILSQPINKQIQQNLGVDVQFSSSFDDTKNATVPKVTLSRQLTPKLSAVVSRTFDSSVTQDAKLQYKMNNRVSVIGSWEGKDLQNETVNQQTDTPPSVLGLDLEYKLEFK